MSHNDSLKNVLHRVSTHTHTHIYDLKYDQHSKSDTPLYGFDGNRHCSRINIRIVHVLVLL